MTETEVKITQADRLASLNHHGFDDEADLACWGSDEYKEKVDETANLLARHRTQSAAQKDGSVLLEALERANTLLTKAVGDIVALRIIAGKKTSADATAEYVESINAIDAIRAAIAQAQEPE
jgi:hypothetical protein